MVTTARRQILFDTSFREAIPHFRMAAIEATVQPVAASPLLSAEVAALISQRDHTLDSIKDIAGVAATRAAYKALGKAPSRYRPACEQLWRRAVKGESLVGIDTLVDIGNLLSLYAGCSVGVFDADLVGQDIRLGVGEEGEPYESIGRGLLNVSHMPIYRDEKGAFATPTSDAARTQVTETTVHTLIFINDYRAAFGTAERDAANPTLEDAVSLCARLLTEYALAEEVSVSYFSY